MNKWKYIKGMVRILAVLLGTYLVVVALVCCFQRSLIFLPSHREVAGGLKPWRVGEETIGYCREAPHAHTVWLMLHGNAGQAADREYVLPRMSADDSLYVLEYPGYGGRAGSPSRATINEAASAAYRKLREQYPDTPVCVLGESIGGGPACTLASEPVPPDKIVLVTPFDSLANVAAGHYSLLPVRLLLWDAWDNAEALADYKGPVDIFGAKQDTIIPMAHALALAEQVPTARFVEISGGHNDWSRNRSVKIER